MDRTANVLVPELRNAEVEDKIGSGGLIGLAAATYQEDELADSQQHEKAIAISGALHWLSESRAC